MWDVFFCLFTDIEIFSLLGTRLSPEIDGKYFKDIIMGYLARMSDNLYKKEVRLVFAYHGSQTTIFTERYFCDAIWEKAEKEMRDSPKR